MVINYKNTLYQTNSLFVTKFENKIIIFLDFVCKEIRFWWDGRQEANMCGNEQKQTHATVWLKLEMM